MPGSLPNAASQLVPRRVSSTLIVCYVFVLFFSYLSVVASCVLVGSSTPLRQSSSMGSGTAVLQQPPGLSISEDVIKPRCDKLGYRVVKLPNELRVLLISDPETDKAAAALNVSDAHHAEPFSTWQQLRFHCKNALYDLDMHGFQNPAIARVKNCISCTRLHLAHVDACPASRAVAALAALSLWYTYLQCPTLKVHARMKEETTKVTAGLNINCIAAQVRVGSMCDPVELPGLAHFCEHMLFYSSEKYPVEDEYSRWAVACNRQLAV